MTGQVSPFTGRPRTVRPRWDAPLMPVETSPRPPENAPGKSPVLPGVVPLGTFTVVHPDTDQYETIKIERGTGNFHDKVMAGHISGSDNSRDFQMFCFVNPDGSLKIWSRFQGIDDRWPQAVQTVLLMDREGRLDATQAYAMRSSRCARCGLKLTVPESLHRGFGPECWGQIGW